MVAVGFVAVVACIGLAVYRDYGISWDEPEYYEYARTIRNAYSLEDHLEQDFQVENAFGSTSYFHRFYGPAYLLIAGGALGAVRGALPGSEYDLWHLLNYLTFLAGGVCLYWLARRWVGHLASFGVLSLYVLQPVLWGNAFINPKDIPFTTFFIAAVLAGYRMIDAVPSAPSAATAAPPGRSMRFLSTRRAIRPLVVAGLALSLVLLLASKGALLDLVEGMIHAAYTRPDSLLGMLLRLASPRVGQLPVEAYLRKASVLTLGLRLAMLCGLSAALATAAWISIPSSQWNAVLSTCIAGLALGLATSTRILGPLAGALVCLHALSRPSRGLAALLLLYGAVAAGVTYATWPYLWAAPVQGFLHVLTEMASVPETLDVLYAGRIVSSEVLPGEYMPRLMLLTLTEPALLLAFAGGWRLARRLGSKSAAVGLLPIVLWYALPVGYAVAAKLPLHDSYRHFLFVLPPLFILAGLGLQWIFNHVSSGGLRAAILAASLAPAAYGIVLLHPFEYTHFNVASGGMRAAYHNYETDYWLTCYREAMQSAFAAGYTTIFVYRQPTLAALSARAGVAVQAYDPLDGTPAAPPHSALLLTTRENLDLSVAPESERVLEVGRGGAVFCVLKSVESADTAPGS